jgi:hypothetical protein
MTAPIDVVIISWNDGDLLPDAVSSCWASVDVHLRVIVVDNGSDPPVVVPEPVHLIRNSANRGVAPARNQGAAVVTAPYVCFLDSDARLEPGCLVALAEQLELVKDAGVAVPVFAGQHPTASAGRAPGLADKLRRLANRTDLYRAMGDVSQTAWDVDFGIGACLLARTDAFRAVGGFDESFFYGPEDVDFCLRVKERGWRVLQVRDATCVHPPRRRYRRPLGRRGLYHAWAVSRYLWRHRSYLGTTV